MSEFRWYEDEVALELATLWAQDTDRKFEGWFVAVDENGITLRLGLLEFTVIVRETT